MPMPLFDSSHFFWLFDRRFDTLAIQFRQFLQNHGVQNPTLTIGHEIFPDIEASEGEKAIFRQQSPETINHRFMRHWEKILQSGTHRPTSATVAAFTLAGLKPNKQIKFFGAGPIIETALNSKIAQMGWLADAGFLVRTLSA